MNQPTTTSAFGLLDGFKWLEPKEWDRLKRGILAIESEVHADLYPAPPLDAERLLRALRYGIERQFRVGSAVSFDLTIGSAVVEYARLAAIVEVARGGHPMGHTTWCADERHPTAAPPLDVERLAEAMQANQDRHPAGDNHRYHCGGTCARNVAAEYARLAAIVEVAR